jgi:tetratricopeptide (TPR) repeat protein
MVKDRTNHEIARSHLKSARYLEAVHCYKQMLKKNPGDAEAWLSMGGAHRALGEYEKAIDCYNKALEINPENDDHWYYRGKIFARLSNHEEAIMRRRLSASTVFWSSLRQMSSHGYLVLKH